MIGVDPVGLSPLGMAFGKKKKPETPQGRSGRFHKVYMNKAHLRGVVVSKVEVIKVTLHNA